MIADSIPNHQDQYIIRTKRNIKMNRRKKAISIVSVILIVFLSFFSYIKISDNYRTVRLPEEIVLIPLEFTNIFLIPLKEGYMLFDNGYEKEYDYFLNKLKRNNIDVMDIRYVMISHHHDDHVGFLNRLTALNPSLKVILHEKSVPLLAAGKNNQKNGGGIVNSRIYALFRLKQLITPGWDFSFPPYSVRDTDIILRGESAELPEEVGLKSKVVYTPGHSSDSISLVYKDEYIFAGDMASNFLNLAGAKHLTLFNEDVGVVYSLWEKVLSMNIRYIIPAHGRPFGAERLKENLHKYSQKDLVVYF
ncbi:MAG: hypothetical protein CVV49_18215 [Spirochaetae bacterium HGW-Spirochaetae-5]|nr:MAG: hypothetical protein CVV49_18215 [Spirochaetae bacterium HGW-Spirochaetae-5]